MEQIILQQGRKAFKKHLINNELENYKREDVTSDDIMLLGLDQNFWPKKDKENIFYETTERDQRPQDFVIMGNIEEGELKMTQVKVVVKEDKAYIPLSVFNKIICKQP